MVEITSERQNGEDLIRRIDRNTATDFAVELFGQEARRCGISVVSWQARCFLSLRLDMQWDATGLGRRRRRDDRNAGARSCNGGFARLSGVRVVASGKVLIGSIDHDSEWLVSSFFLLCIGPALRKAYGSLHGPCI